MVGSHLTEAQSLDPDAIVMLFTVDLTDIGGDVYYWTPGPIDGAPAVFQGITYTSFPVLATGFEYSGRGPLPAPQLIIPNVAGFATGLAIIYGDVLGGKVTRLRTFKKYLDGEPEADPTAYWTPDIFYFHRKVQQDNTVLILEMRSILDQEGVMIPARQIIRDTCSRIYRRWNGSSFDYTKATCPYAGSMMFKADGTGTANPAEDVCGKRLSDCTSRFGGTSDSPARTYAFPGASKIVT